MDGFLALYIFLLAAILGHEIIARVPLKLVRVIAAALFLVIGLWLLAETAGWF